MSKNDGVYTPHVHYRTERNGKQVISRETIEMFLNWVLEYQEIGGERLTDNLHFEINGQGFVVTIWTRDFNEHGVNMWYYYTNPEHETHRHGSIMSMRDPYLVEARKRVEKLMEQVRADWAEQLRAKGEMK